MDQDVEKSNHYNDWPNAQGVYHPNFRNTDFNTDAQQFDVRYEELEPTELEVSGVIPAYCAGVLFRNGLGPRELKTEKNDKVYRTNHWFDCLAQVHRFQIYPPSAGHPSVRVTHNSRRTCDGLIEQIVKTGELRGITFAAKYDPCMSFFQKIQSFFTYAPKATKDNVNVCVTLSPNFPGLSKTAQAQDGPHDSSKLVESLVNKTDASIVQALDPETLEPLGIARQTLLHPDLKGPTSAAHAKCCPVTGDVYNYNLDFGRNCTYRVFHVSASTGRCSILATFPGQPAYIHSLLLTENYVIICVWNSHFAASGISILWKQNYLDAISEFDDKQPAKWYVVDRRGGKGLVATYESDPFFCFHTINAYEEPSTTHEGATDIIADLCAYDSLDVLKRFYLENMASDSSGSRAYADPKYTSARAYYRRFRLPNIPSDISTRRSSKQEKETSSISRVENVHSGEKGFAPELPSINRSVHTKKHRYIYGVLDTGKSTFFDGLVKYDTTTLAPCATWSVFGQSAGEPIFVKDPSRLDEEDAGVLLTGVLDGIEGRSYLLVLDAKNLQELGRASCEKGPGGIIGFGFHGAHVQASGNSEGC